MKRRVDGVEKQHQQNYVYRYSLKQDIPSKREPASTICDEYNVEGVSTAPDIDDLEMTECNEVTPSSSDEQESMAYRCKQHKLEEVKFYCEVHKKLICYICHDISHKKCQTTRLSVNSSNQRLRPRKNTAARNGRPKVIASDSAKKTDPKNSLNTIKDSKRKCTAYHRSTQTTFTAAVAIRNENSTVADIKNEHNLNVSNATNAATKGKEVRPKTQCERNQVLEEFIARFEERDDFYEPEYERLQYLLGEVSDDFIATTETIWNGHFIVKEIGRLETLLDHAWKNYIAKLNETIRNDKVIMTQMERLNSLVGLHPEDFNGAKSIWTEVLNECGFQRHLSSLERSFAVFIEDKRNRVPSP